MKTAIFLNSGRKTERTVSADKIICADGGFDICPAKPDYIVGDCDSVHNIPEEVKVYRHDPRKNFTDGEAAVYLAKEIGSNEAIFYGVTGGRCDHVLGNIDIMALADYLGMTARAEENDCDIHFVHADEGTPFTLAVGKGRTVSIIPHGGDALVTDSRGLEYPLQNLTLTSHDSRGVSNVTSDDEFSIRVVKGAVLVFVNR